MAIKWKLSLRKPSMAMSKPPNAGKPWSNTDLTTLAGMIFDKDSYSKMAFVLGRTQGSIKAMIDGNSGEKSYNLLKKAFIAHVQAIVKSRPPAALKPGQIPLALDMTFKPEPPAPETSIATEWLRPKPPIARKTKVAHAWPFFPAEVAPVKPNPLRHRKQWTKSEDNYLNIMFKNKESLTTMAVRLGRTDYSVLGRLSHLKHLVYNKSLNAYFYRNPTIYFQL